MTSAPRIPPAAHVVTTYEDLMRALAAERRRIGMTQLDMDHRAGWAEGYTGKIEAMLTRPTARNARGLGANNFPLALGAVKAVLLLVPEGSTRALVPAHVSGAAGGRKRADNLSPDRRREIAAKAAAARWAKTAASPVLHETMKP